MRAVFRIDPAGGPGYGIIDIYGIGETNWPAIVIRRMSDGRTLAPGGWRSGENSISPDRQEYVDDHPRLWFGPEVTNDMDMSDSYEIGLPGFGSCPISLEKIIQSSVIDNTGAGITPPPPARTQTPPENDSGFAEKIFEGAGETPDIEPGGGFAGPSGVAAAPVGAEADHRPKKTGCIVLGIALLAGWVAGGVYFWRGAMNAPVADKENSISFEIIPKALDSSIAGDSEEEKKNGKP